MTERRFPFGTFGWVELATTDRTAAREFYGSLLGWTVNEVDMGEMGKYTLFQLDGKDVAGMYTSTDAQKQQSVPPHWMSYVLVESTDETSGRAAELGATIVVEPFDVPGVGRMAFVQDPAGARFALFQPGRHPGAAPMDNRPGMFCWNELLTRDTSSARSFYTSLFGWRAEESKSPTGAVYTTFSNHGRLAGGMLPISPEMGDVPPSWGVYFAVESCDGSLDKAKSSGAHVVLPPMEIPDVGRFALLSDPQGALFTIIALDAPEPN